MLISVILPARLCVYVFKKARMFIKNKKNKNKKSIPLKEQSALTAYHNYKAFSFCPKQTNFFMYFQLMSFEQHKRYLKCFSSLLLLLLLWATKWLKIYVRSVTHPFCVPVCEIPDVLAAVLLTELVGCAPWTQFWPAISLSMHWQLKKNTTGACAPFNPNETSISQCTARWGSELRSGQRCLNAALAAKIARMNIDNGCISRIHTLNLSHY